MVSKEQKIQFSEHASLYDILIPENHPFRKVEAMVDWDSIRKELTTKYSENMGRAAEDPIRMFKYCLLKAWFCLSDVDLVSHAMYDMSFKWFLGLMPEDGVIDASSLCKFRKLRLKDMDMMSMLLEQTTNIARSKGLFKTSTIIVDATHSHSRAVPHSPAEIVYKHSRALREAYEKTFPQDSRVDLPENPDKEDAAKEIERAEILIEEVARRTEGALFGGEVTERMNYLKEIIEDVKDGRLSENDQDAKRGHKSTTKKFYGYKAHIGMTPERIIVSAVVTPGNVDDGSMLPEILEQCREDGIEVDTVIGDTAYSAKKILDMAKGDPKTGEGRLKIVAKLNPVISNGMPYLRKAPDPGFTYNKDADSYVCPAGHLPERKLIKNRQKQRPKHSNVIYYKYSEEHCSKCPLKKECLQEGAKRRNYSVRIYTDVHRQQMEFEKSEEFRRLSKERYKIEAKNSELKNALGCKRAQSYGVGSMSMQYATAIFVSNLKRIMRLEGIKG